MPLRITAIILLLLSVLFWPFWVSVVLCLAGMAYFRLFFEGVALFLLSDLLYGVPEPRFFGFTFMSLLFAVIAMIAIELMKKRLKFYPNKLD